MKRKFFLSVLILFACLVAAPVPAHADMGPKPSVVVTFRNLRQKNCYATLLAQEESTGPHSVYNPGSENKYTGDAPKIWEKFAAYRDADGYHFLQFYQKLDADGVFRWGYFPPKKFKILLYFPDDGTFAASREACESYAFDSYFTVDASALGTGGAAGGTVLSARRSYDYSGETVSLLVRILLTIAVELLIALPFGFRSARQLGFIAAVNAATQVTLNVLLNLVDYREGQLASLLLYFLLEVLVIVIEAAVYSRSATLAKGAKPGKKHHPVLYALTANIASYAAGLALFFAIPQYL